MTSEPFCAWWTGSVIVCYKWLKYQILLLIDNNNNNKQTVKPSKRIVLLMKYVASGHMIINILKKTSFLSTCTGVSSTLQPTLQTLCNLLNNIQVLSNIGVKIQGNISTQIHGTQMNVANENH